MCSEPTPEAATLTYEIVYSVLVIDNTREKAELDTPEFHATASGTSANVVMKVSVSTQEEARGIVEPYLRAWEFTAGAQFGTPALTFRFHGVRIPTPGVASVSREVISFASIAFSVDAFPSPPSRPLSRDRKSVV